MNKIIQLTKVFLKTSFRYKGTSNTKESSKGKKILTIIGAAILIAYIAGIFGVVSYGMISMLNEIGQPAVFIGITLLSIALLLLIQTLISSMNLFYFSKDIEYILPLPLRPHEIVIAKFNTILITEYITVFAFLLVPFIIYGIVTGAGVLFYLYALLVLIVFPILPALISSIIVMLLMSITGIIKNKDKFQTIATTLMIVAIIAFSMSMTGMEETTDEETLQMLTQFNGLVEQIDGYFITLGDSIGALTSYNSVEGLYSITKLIIITFIAYVVFVLIAQKLYFKGAVGAIYSGKKKKARNKEIEYTRQSVAKSYIKKEFVQLFKNSIFFTQCILPSILMPAIILVSAISGAGGLEELEAQGMGDMSIMNTIGLCVILGINTFLFSMNFIPVTSISREGENANFMKYIPISLSAQCTYKIVPAVVMNMISSIIVIVVAAIGFKVDALFIIINIAVSLLLSILYSYLMIIVDLKRPKLKWDTEYAVVKQNLNMIWGFIFALVVVVLLIIIGAIFVEMNYLVIALCLIMAIVCGIYFIKEYIDRNQEKLFEKVQ